MVVDPSVASLMDKQYDKTTASESQTIKGYLTELAAQKNIIISHNQYGNVLFTRAKTKQQPILNYGEVGGAPFTNMNLSFNGQAMHSDITVIRQATKNNPNSGRATVKNPYVPYVYRPKVVVQTSGDDIDTEQAARNVLSAELKNLRLTIETDRWEIDGKIIKPNSIISVVNPKVYLFKKSNWFVESIDFKGDNKKTIATLNCVIPEVYNNDTPTYLFKGINLH
jgi:prophage tail gpP-like protein